MPGDGRIEQPFCETCNRLHRSPRSTKFHLRWSQRRGRPVVPSPGDALRPGGSPGARVIEELRAATRDAHRRAERATGLLRAPDAWSAYVRYLAKQHGLLRPLEPTLDEGLAALGLDPAARRKGHLVAADLAALGVDAPGLARCGHLPATRPLARAVGCIYVVEGQTLGGRVLLRRLAARLDIDRGRGASFLDAYAGRTAERWRELAASLEAFGCRAPGEVSTVVAGALEAFDRISAWLERP
jgi:heme oxygenase